MKITELMSGIPVWTTNEEAKLLKTLQKPKKLNALNDHDQFKVQSMIRKNLIQKKGYYDPSVTSNEKKNS
jgi:hypothetical protein